MLWFRVLSTLFLAPGILCQEPGDGNSKSTYSTSEALKGMAFNMKYFPVLDDPGSCDGDVCDCVGTTGDLSVHLPVEQGRVYLSLNKTVPNDNGKGFGLHMVNCSTNPTPDGISTDEVEAYFTSKLGDMSSYDAFMDYNVALLTADLDSYAAKFDADAVPYLPVSWADQGTDYYGIIVHVPTTQMVIEVMALASSATVAVAAHPKLLHVTETRASTSSLARAQLKLEERVVTSDVETEGARGEHFTDLLEAINVGRAASDLEALDEFYLNGIKLNLTLSFDDLADTTGAPGASTVSKRCYLWARAGSTVDVCFTKRADAATSGSFKVSNFEEMLNSVHAATVENLATTGYCWNKWADNHYAVDSHGSTAGDFDYIAEYILTSGAFFYCGGSGAGVAGLHYMVDPTGWGVQMDFDFGDDANARICGRNWADWENPYDCPCTGMGYCGGTGVMSRQ